MGERTDEMSGDQPTEDLAGDPTRSPDHIRQGIRSTQREMSETIDEIQYRLSPQHMMEQTKQSVRRAGVNTSRNFIDKVKDHPVPAAMVGVGLWLMLRNSDDSGGSGFYGSFDRDRYESGNRGYEPLSGNRSWGADSAYSGTFGQHEEGGRFDAVREKAGELKDKAGSLVSSASEKTSDAMHEVGDRAQQFKQSAGSGIRRARYQSRDLMRENPMVLGLAAIAAGALLGSLIPETEKENQLMGEAKDKLTDQAKELAHEGMDKVKNVASAVGEAVKDTAQEAARSEGLTSGGPTTGASGSRTGATDIGTSITPGMGSNRPSGNR